MAYRPIRFPSVGSTNDVVREAARAGVEPGLVVQGDVQLHGKSRKERDWRSPRGGLWMSVLLSPTVPEPARGLVPLAVGIACCEGIDDLGVEVQLRWPNDLMLDDRKVGGILVESRTEEGQLSQIVAGIGINVTNDPPVEGAARLADASSSVSVRRVRDAILDRLEGTEALLSEGRPKAICNRFMRHAWGIDRELLLDGEPRIPKEIALDGALIVETLDGQIEVHRTGSLREPV